jgi:hypothetical protein
MTEYVLALAIGSADASRSQVITLSAFMVFLLCESLFRPGPVPAGFAEAGLRIVCFPGRQRSRRAIPQNTTAALFAMAGVARFGELWQY